MGVGPRSVQNRQTKTSPSGFGENWQLRFANHHQINQGRFESHSSKPRGSKGARQGKPNRGPKHASQAKGQQVGASKHVVQGRLRGKTGRGNQKPSCRHCGAVRGRGGASRCVGTTPSSIVGHPFSPTRSRSKAHSSTISSPSSSDSRGASGRRDSRDSREPFDQTVLI